MSTVPSMILANDKNVLAKNLLGISKIQRLTGNEIKDLVSKGYNVNEVDKNNDTALLIACTHNQSIIPDLIEAGADVNCRNNEGVTPLIDLMYHFNSIDVKLANKMLDLLLLSGANANTCDNKGNYPLTLIKPTSSQSVDVFLNHKDKINFNVSNENSKTLLMCLAEHDSNEEKEDGGYLLKLLILGCCCLEQEDALGQTAIHYAAENMSASGVQLLAEFGVDINKQDKYGNTPLMCAIYMSSYESKQEHIEWLLKNNANVDLKDKQKETALMIAAEYNSKVINLLLDSSDETLNDKNKDGETALHISIKHDNMDSVDKLLECPSLNKMVLDNLDNNYLMYAINEGACVDMILAIINSNEQDIDFDYQNKNGETVFSLALKHYKNNDNVIKALTAKKFKQEASIMNGKFNKNKSKKSKKML